MLLGDVQMAAPSLSKFEKYTKKLRIFDLPFMFKDMEAVDRFQQSEAGQKLKDSMRRKGLQGLAFWHNGMKQLSANAPLVSPADAVGKKFRIMSSDVLKAQFEALKANPQKMAFSEVYSSLQTGVVDGQENTWSNIYTKKFFEVQDGVTESNHGVLDYLVVTSTEFWDSLPADVQQQLSQILNEVTAEANANSGAINMANRQKIIDAGKEVRQLTTAQREAWVEALKPVWNQFEKDVGADLIDAAQKANQG
jgi:C4-dicarboxylate-binding protein DctP